MKLENPVTLTQKNKGKLPHVMISEALGSYQDWTRLEACLRQSMESVQLLPKYDKCRLVGRMSWLVNNTMWAKCLTTMETTTDKQKSEERIFKDYQPILPKINKIFHKNIYGGILKKKNAFKKLTHVMLYKWFQSMEEDKEKLSLIMLIYTTQVIITGGGTEKYLKTL